jgi:hypothetical protein
MTVLPLIAFLRCGDKGKMEFRLIKEMSIEVVAVALSFSAENLCCTATDTIYLIGSK